MQHIIESFRYKLPFVIAGFASMALSIYLYFVQDDRTAAIFVGLWVPSIHSLGSLLLSADPTHAAESSSDDRVPTNRHTNRKESWS